jgi:membrane carboxypeptidase/penicillin-binding protein
LFGERAFARTLTERKRGVLSRRVLPASHHPGRRRGRWHRCLNEAPGRFRGGKTGTTDNENDAWFAGFTSDVTVVVWVGYDNARGKRTLGRGGTGAQASAPIVGPIIQAAWILQSPKAPLPPPSAEAVHHRKALPIDLNSGQRLASAKNSGFT